MLTGGFVGAQSTMKVSAGTTIKTSGGVSVVLSDMDLESDGSINQASGDGGFKFNGTQGSAIKGNSMPVIGILEVNKTDGGKLLLNRNISINSSLNFISGQLDLNGYNITMNSSAMIAGESENNRVIGSAGGFVEITMNMNSPNSINAGNLGAFITSASNLGAVTIRRGHASHSGAGLAASTNRYYEIIPSNNSNLNATVRLKYFDAELNGQNENSLVIYQSPDDGINWNNISRTGNSTNSNYVEKSGVASLFLQTLANDNTVVGAVSGLTFTGQRKKPSEVQLNWTSQTETNMSGYQVERKLDTEADFTDRSYVNTLAPAGNSNSLLSYQNIDANSHTGTSYYRLKIIDQFNSISYSNVISVPGKLKGKSGGGNNNNLTSTDGEETLKARPVNSFANQNTSKITVGPNPNNGNFWFSVNGIEQETIATLYTIDGKQVRQLKIANLRQQQVNNLKGGIYILKVPGIDPQKIIVNAGINTPIKVNHTTMDNSKL
jgi:hypothetical protein